MVQRGIRDLTLAVMLCVIAAGGARAHDEPEHGPGSRDVRAGAFPVHLVPLGNGFEVHVHDAVSHKAVDLSRAKSKATLLVTLHVPGQKQAQTHFTSTRADAHAR